MSDAPAEADGRPARKRGGGFGLTALVLGVVLLVVTVAMVAAGPAGYRLGTLSLEAATAGVAQSALYAAAATALISAIGLTLSAIKRRPRGVIVGIAVLTAASMIGFRAYSWQIDRANLPPIYDVQTDWDRPVAFSENTLRARESLDAAPILDDARVREGYGRWSGMSFAAAQSVVYELAPIEVRLSVPEATVAVADAAERLGWAVMLSDPPNGQVEASMHSFWYGLAADVAVRVTPSEGGARIDMRSVSRVAGPDMGGNARRIKTLLDDVAFNLRGG